MKALRIYFGLVGRLLPGVAARRFIQVFCTPQRFSLKPPHEALLARAEQFHLQMDSVAEPGRGLRLTGYRWPAAPEARRVLVLHGWSGKAADFYKLIPALEQAGFAVDALDMPAHGASEGHLCSEVDMEAALRAYLAAHGVPYAIVAHSLGAAATVLSHCGPNRALPVAMPERLVLLTHPVILDYAFTQAFALLGLPKRAWPAVYTRLRQQFGLGIESFDLLDTVRPLPAQVLSVHVPHDEEAPAAHTAAFLHAYPGVQGLLIPDGTHSHIMRHPAAIEAAVGFLL